MLGENDELEIVKRLSGVYDNNRIEKSEIGWTSRVYVVHGGKIVFKFPRNEKWRAECKNEVAALRLIKEQKFNLSVPALNWTTEDNAYFGFYGVTGKPLREVIDSLSKEQKTEIGAQVGKFLQQLHGIRNCGEIPAQTLEEQVLEYQDWYKRGKGSLVEIFSVEELWRIDDFFAYEVPKCMVGTNELVFCHGDLDYNNTLIDCDGRVGVIDFGDAGLYDRSQDFRGMDDEILLDSMVSAYGNGEIISRDAAQATSKMIDVLNLIHCIENGYTDGVDNIDNCKKRVRFKILETNQ
ncbi:MAG: aminoglycoside phosphotransferase family protein [Coriobacteriia bacterium]|nr:aminoglycoside phosphotransferase family protein [Coriobacteriia bacterium]